MTLTYRYTGDQPGVFITLRKDDSTWTPSKGDEIDSEVPIAHPLLELVSQDEVPEVVEEPVVEEPVNEPAEPEITESPISADDKEN